MGILKGKCNVGNATIVNMTGSGSTTCSSDGSYTLNGVNEDDIIKCQKSGYFGRYLKIYPYDEMEGTHIDWDIATWDPHLLSTDKIDNQIVTAQDISDLGIDQIELENLVGYPINYSECPACNNWITLDGYPMTSNIFLQDIDTYIRNQLMMKGDVGGYSYRDALFSKKDPETGSVTYNITYNFIFNTNYRKSWDGYLGGLISREYGSEDQFPPLEEVSVSIGTGSPVITIRGSRTFEGTPGESIYIVGFHYDTFTSTNGSTLYIEKYIINGHTFNANESIDTGGLGYYFLSPRQSIGTIPVTTGTIRSASVDFYVH